MCFRCFDSVCSSACLSFCRLWQMGLCEDNSCCCSLLSPPTCSCGHLRRKISALADMLLDSPCLQWKCTPAPLAYSTDVTPTDSGSNLFSCVFAFTLPDLLCKRKVAGSYQRLWGKNVPIGCHHPIPTVVCTPALTHVCSFLSPSWTCSHRRLWRQSVPNAHPSTHSCASVFIVLP